MVHKPTTFFTRSTDLIILDSKKNPFYWHDNKEQHINFNLPKGRYYSNVPLTVLEKFEPYGNETYPRLPGHFLRNIKIFPRRNKNKASISLEHKLIFADPKFYFHEYLPTQTFTALHEVFHYKYHAKNARERKNWYIRQYYEKKCDMAARNFMLANGWNPSQVDFAIQNLLDGKERKECIRLCTTDKKNNFRR
jgi:hypothetical protein